MSFWFLLALVSAPAPVEIHYMAPGMPLKLQSGEEVRYFVFEEYKILLKMDADLWNDTRKLADYMDMAIKYGELVTAKEVIIDTLKDDKRILSDEVIRKDALWKDAERKLIAASGGPIWPYFMAATGAVLAVVGVTLAVVSIFRLQHLSLR